MGSHAGYLFDHQFSTLGESPDCIVVAGQLGSRNQVLTKVQLIIESPQRPPLRPQFSSPEHKWMPRARRRTIHRRVRSESEGAAEDHPQRLTGEKGGSPLNEDILNTGS